MVTGRKDPSISLEDKAAVVEEVASGPGLEEQSDFWSTETAKAFRQVERRGWKYILERVTLTGVATARSPCRHTSKWPCETSLRPNANGLECDAEDSGLHPESNWQAGWVTGRGLGGDSHDLCMHAC